MGITVYADPNFKGQSASFRDDTPNLALDRLNDKDLEHPHPQRRSLGVVPLGRRLQKPMSGAVGRRD